MYKWGVHQEKSICDHCWTLRKGYHHVKQRNRYRASIGKIDLQSSLGKSDSETKETQTRDVIASAGAMLNPKQTAVNQKLAKSTLKKLEIETTYRFLPGRLEAQVEITPELIDLTGLNHLADDLNGISGLALLAHVVTSQDFVV